MGQNSRRLFNPQSHTFFWLTEEDLSREEEDPEEEESESEDSESLEAEDGRLVPRSFPRLFLSASVSSGGGEGGRRDAALAAPSDAGRLSASSGISTSAVLSVTDGWGAGWWPEKRTVPRAAGGGTADVSEHVGSDLVADKRDLGGGASEKVRLLAPGGEKDAAVPGGMVGDASLRGWEMVEEVCSPWKSSGRSLSPLAACSFSLFLLSSSSVPGKGSAFSFSARVVMTPLVGAPELTVMVGTDSDPWGREGGREAARAPGDTILAPLL